MDYKEVILTIRTRQMEFLWHISRKKKSLANLIFTRLTKGNIIWKKQQEPLLTATKKQEVVESHHHPRLVKAYHTKEFPVISSGSFYLKVLSCVFSLLVWVTWYQILLQKQSILYWNVFSINGKFLAVVNGINTVVTL